MTAPSIRPFKGIIYNQEKAGDISSIVCPPYDVISDSRPYYASSDFNAIRLELPQAIPLMDQYETARETLTMWLRESVLKRDDKEGFYVCEQDFEIEGRHFTRRGFIGLRRLDRQTILVHEETRKKAKADREQLISTLRTFTSLIFGLYEDREGLVDGVLSDPKRELVYDFRDEQSIRNRFYRMTSADSIARLVSLMEGRKTYIADGHHRLDVSYRLGLSYTPMYLTDMHGEGIVVLPYHRLVNFKVSRTLENILGKLGEYGDIEKKVLPDGEDVTKMLRQMRDTEGYSFVLYSKEDTKNLYRVVQKRPYPPYDNQLTPPSLKSLQVNIVHNGIIKGLLGIEDEEISFTQDADSSAESIRKGSCDLAFFLPPTSVGEIRDIAENGLYMPPKSTFFFPKILTGLVFYQYA